MSKVGYTIFGAAAAWVAANVAARYDAATVRQLVGLRKFDVKPGAWFCYYMGDYMTHFGEDKPVPSAIVHVGEDVFVWATETPEWDRDWFEKQGWLFPERWMPHSQLAQHQTELKEIGT